MAVRVEYAVQESITNIRRNFFMSFAAILIVAVSLFLTGGALLLRTAISRTTGLLTGNVRVTVFLTTDISQDQRNEIQRDLLQMQEVSSVEFESKQEAYQNFRRLFANQPEIVENTSPDALPESFRIRLKDPKKFRVIRDRLEGRPGIRAIRDERAFVKRLFDTTDKMKWIALLVALAVGIAALILIATTIRMAIYARRKEIGIMKLVGATNWFIRVPFMLEGMVQGVVGASVAVVLLLPSRPLLAGFAPGDYRFTISFVDIAGWGAVLMATGVVVGAVGSLLGLRRFLDV